MPFPSAMTKTNFSRLFYCKA